MICFSFASNLEAPAQVLLRFRADLDSPCRNGLTPLTGVASLANPETVKERSKGRGPAELQGNPRKNAGNLWFLRMFTCFFSEEFEVTRMIFDTVLNGFVGFRR